MPPAFNLSQDQTLQFNLCFVPFLAGSEEPSLTQNTDRIVLSNFPIFLCEHLINLKFPTLPKHCCRTPLSAHTYRLLIFKEPTYLAKFCNLSHCFWIVVFANSKEAELCVDLNYSSSTSLSFFLLIHLYFAKTLKHTIHQQSQLLCSSSNLESTPINESWNEIPNQR